MIGNAEEAVLLPELSAPQGALLCLHPPSWGAPSGARAEAKLGLQARAAPQGTGADAAQPSASDGTQRFSLSQAGAGLARAATLGG